MRRALCGCAWLVLLTGLFASLNAQTPPPVPKPFPQPAGQRPVTSTVPPERAGQAAPTDPGAAPSEAALGVAIYPNAQFITSYDAGQRQRYYLFGSNASFAEVVAYYRNLLKDKGDLVFDEPPVHQFDIGRFREESMAFPPSVTVKDYTWGGMGGFLNPTPGAQPQRFKTIIQIVPMPRQEEG